MSAREKKIKDRTKIVAVVIPCYRVIDHVLNVISKIGQEVTSIYVIDDCCPDHSGEYVRSCCKDPRVKVLWNEKNLGVGGAVMAGYRAAIEEGADVIVKIDGDGQMDPGLISEFIIPIVEGIADYVKGNRFYFLDDIRTMPRLRVFGNAILSLITKFSSGYWNIFDPTNGYTAIHANVARRLPFAKIDRRYFFESDMLYHLNTMRAVVFDIPMSAQYGDEVSNMNILRVVFEFTFKNTINFAKRIFYNYYLRGMSIASFELPFGLLLALFGIVFGIIQWINSWERNIPTGSGTVMLSALPILMGTQLILSFLNYDISVIPRRPLHLLHRIQIEGVARKERKNRK